MNEARQLADGLTRLANEFKSADPVQSSAIKKAFKGVSLNANTRVVAYLLEVVGSKDQQCKALQDENKDLRELLKLNNISLDEDKKIEDTVSVNNDESVNKDST